MLKIYILIAVIGLVGGVVYGGIYYYKDTQSRIQILTENSAKLEMVAEEQTNTIDVLIQDREKFQQLNNELQTNLNRANDYKDVLIGKLRKHDLLKLSLQKPGLVEWSLLLEKQDYKIQRIDRTALRWIQIMIYMWHGKSNSCLLFMSVNWHTAGR